jgi:septation ring formation regulator EzrA
MNLLEQLPELGQEEQTRVDKVVATLNAIGSHSETVAEIAHDARNMVTALELYCELLQQPGVLAEPFLHYGGELRLAATEVSKQWRRFTHSFRAFRSLQWLRSIRQQQHWQPCIAERSITSISRSPWTN